MVRILGARAADMSGLKSTAKYAPPDQLAWFCYRFAVAFKASVPVADAVYLIAEDDEYFGECLTGIGHDIHAGIPFHRALSSQGIFPPYLVSMVKVGERTGTLDKVMESLAVYYDHEDYLHHEIKDALTYPLVLICMVAAVMLVLTSKVLPVFSDILSATGAHMPAVADVLMNTGMFVSKHWAWLLGVPIAAGLVLWAWESTPPGREKVARFKAETKLFDGVFSKAYMARISRVMWYALESGLDAGNALTMAAEVVGNEYVAKQIGDCRQKIQQGEDLAEAFVSVGVFPSAFVNMIRVGHTTGELPSMARKMAGMYQDEVYRALQDTVSCIEPVLVSVLSVVIGVVLVAVVLPLIGILSSMG
ncbi:MAG TPA: type II secretion system F family protein [Firmicutes bacterium]|nr:type II secretion system F family protein [Bacillota bacterium]